MANKEQHGTTGGHADHGHPPHLQHHFDTPAQQYDSSKLGMWLFLATEILLFGGLFVVYAVYRGNHPEVFIFAHHFLDTNLGAINTVILLCSSLTMAWGVRASQLGQQKLLVLLLALTLLGGFGFLSVKYVEYKAKWEHGLLWAGQYDPHLESHGEAALRQAQGGRDHDEQAEAQDAEASDHGEAAAAEDPESLSFQVERSTQAGAAEAPQGLAPPAEELPEQLEPTPANAQIFFSIYFLMTGLHGVHVLAGMIIIFVLLLKARKGAYGPAYFTPVDLGGLYWHLVDLIWIFLFPLLYLIH